MRKSWFWVLLLGFVATLVATPTPSMERTRVADGFDYPVGRPNAEGYYMSRGFLPYHPGEDWNSSEGGNKDLGNPVYSVGNGLVVFARDARRGWGNVVIVRHTYISRGQLQSVDSFYAHMQKVLVREGQQVLKGTQVGTIGTNRGMYVAHLHFEMRKNLSIGINRSAFRNDMTNYFRPSAFIEANRSLSGAGRSSLVAVGTFTLPNSMFDAPVDESRGEVSRIGSSGSSKPSLRKLPPPTRTGANTYRVNRFEDLGSF